MGVTSAAPRSKPMGMWAAVSLGIGAMVGAGIFALLGQAGVQAGSAVWISFVVGGVIALFSGYSLAKLGIRYPSSGGLIEYLVQGYGEGWLSGSMSVMFYLSALAGIAMVARTFGDYGIQLFGFEGTLAAQLFTAGVLIAFTALNLAGSAGVAGVEKVIVAIKVGGLVAFAVAAIAVGDPGRMSPSNYPAVTAVAGSIALTFFAFEGFRVITNAVEDMPDPDRDLPRSMTVAILLVTALYVLVAVAVFSALDVDQVAAAKDFALAEATRPLLDGTGFRLMAVLALLSTASGINAAMYAVTNVTYTMAIRGELPEVVSRKVWRSREGLLVSAAILIPVAVFMDIGEIAAVGSMAILSVHAMVHFGHLRLLGETGASRRLVVAALVFTSGAVLVSLKSTVEQSTAAVVVLVALPVSAVLVEGVFRATHGRVVRARIVGRRLVPHRIRD